MTYNEQYVASMALTNILTSLHVLSGLDLIGQSVYLNAHLILVENSIGSIANSFTDAEDGAIGSNIIEMARVLVDSCSDTTSDHEGIRKNAIAAVGKLYSKTIEEEHKIKETKKSKS